MKHMLMTIALLTLLSTTIRAQLSTEYGTPEERAAKMTERLKEGLSLDSGQIEAISNLNLKYARRIQKEVIDTGMNKASAYFRIRKINTEKEKELFPLLSSGQIKQYEKMKAEATRELLARFF